MAKGRKNAKTECEIRKDLRKIIAKNGIAPLKKTLVPAVSLMVDTAKAVDNGTLNGIIDVSEERPRVNFITVGLQLILEHLPSSKMKDEIRSNYEYWLANKARLIELYRLPA